MVHRATELVHIATADDTVTATPNHPFRVAGRGWVAAGELSAGDTLYLADGGRASIVSVTREKLASPVDVYNLEVEDFHTYFVASAGIWVHNCGGETAATARGRAIHTAFDYGEGFVKEFRLDSGRRVDAINFDSRLVMELKPDNARAITTGARQLSGYLDELDTMYPHMAPFSGQVVTYR